MKSVSSTLLVVTLGLCAICPPALCAAPATKTNYHGWPDALRLQNTQVEVIIVPAVSRVMSFRFRDAENVFWEDESLAGRTGDATGKEWINFGGDKSWPSPEAEWKNYTKHAVWMPPPAFDAMPASARIDGDAVVLTSTVDPFYGIRETRRIALSPNSSAMTIETTYERLSGAPAKIGIWVITQFKDPVAVFVPLAAKSQFANGYFSFRDTPWPQLAKTNGTIRLTRDSTGPHKLGADTDRMLWIGQRVMCLVSSPRVANSEYPDRGASAEVYTSPDPKKYVELEMLGPLATLKPGDRISRVNTYTLFHRTNADPDVDARRVLK